MSVPKSMLMGGNMRNPDRIPEILSRLEEVWKDYPDLRFAQLISNVFPMHAPYYMEDEQFIDTIEKFYKGVRYD